MRVSIRVVVDDSGQQGRYATMMLYVAFVPWPTTNWQKAFHPDYPPRKTPLKKKTERERLDMMTTLPPKNL